jgi:hypothetical protein
MSVSTDAILFYGCWWDEETRNPQAWFMSVLTPPSQDPTIPITVGALCDSCAPRVWSPETLKVAEEWRGELLATANDGQGCLVWDNVYTPSGA